MSNKEQNSVEWLVEKIQQANPSFKFDALIRQANAMHKEETCQFVSDYLDDADYGMTAEEYYDQIYGGNDEQQERMYSEEEVIEIAKQYAKRCQATIQSTQWLTEQFKKK